MRGAIATAAIALLLAACAGADRVPATSPAAGSDSAPGAAGSGGRAGTVTVFAAASLTDAFTVLGERFAATRPDVDVVWNFAGSSTLATQITQGARADVFASADARQMEVVADAGLLARAPIRFATNRLQIVVERGNPRGITGLADLARPDTTVVLAAEEVPAGRYTRRALGAQGIEVDAASREVDVRAVLGRVALGEADAGVVYASDLATAGDAVVGVEIPGEENVTARYPIATLTAAPNPEAAAAFVDLVLSPAGRRVLDDHGFAAP